MQTKHHVLLSLGLAAVFAALPYAHAVTTSRTKLNSPTVSPLLPAPASPCTARILAQALASAPIPMKFQQSSHGHGDSIEMDRVSGSCWVSVNEMVIQSAGKLVKFNTITGEDMPIPGTEDALSGKHWASIVSLSPDGRWLVWAGGVDGHSTWDAVTLDGMEHRQWPRDESIGTPAIAWMQDNRHWVELRVPETQVAAHQWQDHRDNMRARVYSLDAPDIQDFPLQLEVPDPNFQLPPNCGKTSEFLFTTDGHAWLTQDWQFAPSPGTNQPCSRQDVYQLLPGPNTWKLHKTYLYPKADAYYWMFDSPARSPDDNWIVWRNYKPDGKSKWRLMLSRTDGSDMRILYQSDSISGGQVEWSPDSRQIAFTDNGPLGICTINLDQVIANDCTKTNDQQHKLASVFGTSLFPVSYGNLKPHNYPLVAARH